MSTCFDCGHEHALMAEATISAGTRLVARSFCHEDDHSCYNDRRGNYFSDINLDVPKEWPLPVIQHRDGSWPSRPTADPNIAVHWHKRGTAPSPDIVASGTGGMMLNVDCIHYPPGVDAVPDNWPWWRKLRGQ